MISLDIAKVRAVMKTVKIAAAPLLGENTWESVSEEQRREHCRQNVRMSTVNTFEIM